jgi:hypothetical protein
VLSVNWSKSMMQAVLQPAAAAAAAAKGQPEQQQQQQQQFEIHANELAWGPDGVSTGDIQREVQCGRDKGRLMDALLQQHRSSSSGGAVVYVGDSSSDILPLLKVSWLWYEVSACWKTTAAAVVEDKPCFHVGQKISKGCCVARALL